MKRQYYSQNGEDCLLWKFFAYKKEGLFIDVGAFDGRFLSNTYSFEQQGWKGICIEPHPVYFKLCNQLRTNSICINAACVKSPDLEKIFFNADEIGLLSGIKKNPVIQKRYQKIGLEFKGFKEIEIQTVTLNQVISQYVQKNQEIDFVSIDVEGTELDVIKGIDLSRYRPRVIVVEINDQEELRNHLVQKNNYYEAISLKQNTFFLRDKDDIDTIQSISFFCKTVNIPHPLGKQYTHPSHTGRLFFHLSVKLQKRFKSIKKK
jgi:FkbM family methyltransferase